MVKGQHTNVDTDSSWLHNMMAAITVTSESTTKMTINPKTIISDLSSKMINTLQFIQWQMELYTGTSISINQPTTEYNAMFHFFPSISLKDIKKTVYPNTTILVPWETNSRQMHTTVTWQLTKLKHTCLKCLQYKTAFSKQDIETDVWDQVLQRCYRLSAEGPHMWLWCQLPTLPYFTMDFKHCRFSVYYSGR